MITSKIKVLGLLGLPLLAIAIAVMLFAFNPTTDTTEAATPGAAMSLRVDASDTFPCAGGPVAGKVCVPLNGKFEVIVVADGIDTGTGYILAQTWIDYDKSGLVHVTATDPSTPAPDVSCATGVGHPCAFWPELAGATFLTFEDPPNNGAAAGGLTGLINPLSSFHKGDLFAFSLTCTSGQSSSAINLVAINVAPAGTSGTHFKDVGNTVTIPSLTGINVNCNPGPTSTPTATPPPIPKMSKIPALSNHFLVRQEEEGKIPPVDCLAGTPTSLSEELGQSIVSADDKGASEFQQLAAFEFEVHYDATKVCVTITVGDAFTAAGAVCVVEDQVSKPQLEGVARVGCVTQGKGHEIDDLAPLATIDVYPQPEVYSQAKPNQSNGVVVQINNVGCDLGDEQGEAIPLFSCDDADITFRYLEGDVDPNCSIDASDAQAIAFRWGTEKGSLIYKDFMNLEPSNQQADNDIDINDLQFVFGRFGSTCESPHPDQDPVNPKA